MTRARIPNFLTGLRVMAAPAALIIIALGIFGAPLPDDDALLFGLFVLASLTDFLDGWLARRWGVISDFGTLMDPIADKLLVGVMLVYLVQMFAAAIPAIMPAAAIIILREIYVSALREFLASRGRTLPVSHGGKLKTALQMLSIGLLLLFLAGPQLHWAASGHAALPGFILLWLAALVSLGTAIDYTRRSLR